MVVAKDQENHEVTLGFQLSALKPVIEKEIVTQFDRLIGPARKA
jgi:hypothetical protein